MVRYIGRSRGQLLVLFMYVLETMMLKACKLIPWVWWRFLDDVLFIWLHGEERLREFLELLKCYHKTVSICGNIQQVRFHFGMLVLIKERGE